MRVGIPYSYKMGTFVLFCLRPWPITRTPGKHSWTDLWSVVKLKRFMKIEYLNNDNLSDLCTAPTYNEDLNWSKWGPNGDSFFSGDLLETCDIWHWLQYWQLRTWIYDNLCYLTINCDTGQHSQFLRCFRVRYRNPCWYNSQVLPPSATWNPHWSCQFSHTICKKG